MKWIWYRNSKMIKLPRNSHNAQLSHHIFFFDIIATRIYVNLYVSVCVCVYLCIFAVLISFERYLAQERLLKLEEGAIQGGNKKGKCKNGEAIYWKL